MVSKEAILWSKAEYLFSFKGKKNKKRDWKEYNGSFFKRAEIIFETRFFMESASRISRDEQKKKDGTKYRDPNKQLLDIAASHSSYISTFIHTARRISKCDDITHNQD
jgi:hypothetical protein